MYYGYWIQNMEQCFIYFERIFDIKDYKKCIEHKFWFSSYIVAGRYIKITFLDKITKSS